MTDKLLAATATEVFLQIVGYVAEDGTHQDLYNLALVRPFNPAATTFLYASIRKDVHQGRGLYRLLRTVLQKPQLGELIHSLDVPSHRDWVDHVEAVPEAFPRYLEKVVRGLRLTDDDEERWVEGLRSTQTREEVMAALLLLHTPNLTHLELFNSNDWSPFRIHSRDQEAPKWWEAVFPHRGLPSFTCRLAPSYPHLTTLCVREFNLDMPKVSPLFRIPSLRRLELIDLTEYFGWDEWTWDWEAEGFAADTSDIEELKIEGYPVHADALAVMLDSCRALRTFSHGLAIYYFDCGGQMMMTRETRPPCPDFQVLGNALAKHKLSLEKLAIHNMVRHPGKPMLGLETFEKLECATVDTCVLWDADYSQPSALPLSLRKLRVEHVWAEWLARVLATEEQRLRVRCVADDEGTAVDEQLRWVDERTEEEAIITECFLGSRLMEVSKGGWWMGDGWEYWVDDDDDGRIRMVR